MNETKKLTLFKLKVTNIGDSVGVVLPKEALEKMQLEKGDNIYLTETDFGFEISGHNPQFEEEMATARQVMKQYRNALRELAQ